MAAVLKENKHDGHCSYVREHKMFSVVFIDENNEQRFHKMSLTQTVIYRNNVAYPIIDCFHYRIEFNIIKSFLMHLSKNKLLGKIVAIEIRDSETNSILLRKYHIINVSPLKYKCISKYGQIKMCYFE